MSTTTVKASSNQLGRQSLLHDRSPLWLVVLLCVIAVAIGFFVRLAWIDWASGIESMHWEGQLQPVTHDSYYHGSAIRQHVEGRLVGVEGVPGVVSNHSLVQWPGMLARWILPVSTDTVLLWMPIFLAGLLAIPVLLIGRALGSVWWGFGAAVLSVTAVNYFERTMAGYYDHDMLSLTWMTMITWLLIEADQRASMNWLRAGVMGMIFVPLLYAAGSIIAIGLGLMWIIQRFVRFPHSPFTRSAIILVAFALALVPFSSGDTLTRHLWPWLIAVAMVLVASRLLRRSPSPRFFIGAVAVGLMLVAFTFPWAETLAKISTYAKGVDLGHRSHGVFSEISYWDAHRTSIMEAMQVSSGEFGYRLLGSGWIALLAAAGYVVACIRRPLMVCLLPMAAVACFATLGGLRFITWGTVPAALGASFLAFAIPRYLATRFGSFSPRSPWVISISVTLSLAMAIPGIQHSLRFSPPSLFTAGEIEALQSLQEASSPEDIAIAWWDYGSGIWYYGDCDVLVHPGRHSDDLFAISHILLGSSPSETAALANSLSGWRAFGRRTPIHKALANAGYPKKRSLPEAMQRITSGTMQPPPHDGRTFLYLPLRQLLFLETIATFRKDESLGIKTRPLPFARLLQGLRLQDERLLVYSDNGLVFDMASGATGFAGEGGRVTPMAFASVLLVEYDNDRGATRIRRMPTDKTGRWATLDRSTGGISVETTRPDPEHELHLVVMPGADAMVLIDNQAKSTNAVQMGVLGAYDPNYFRPVYGSLDARVYEILPGGNSSDAVE